MKILGFDTETTGLDAEKGHKLIEIALLTYDLDSRKLIDKYVQRIDPERAIDAKAQEVHGISYGELVGMPKFAAVAPEAYRRFEEADLLIAHNLIFDATFFLYEFAAVGMKMPDRAVLDTMNEGRWATFDGKSPKLMELCFALGVEYDKAKAHAADYDVMVMMECFWRGLDRGWYKLPEFA